MSEDPYFRREGSHLHVDVPVPLSRAVLGGARDVLTLDGLVSVKVPPGTQADAQLVLRGRGIAALAGGGRRRGDQFVHVRVKVPRDLTPRQRELMEEFAVEEERAAAALGVFSNFKAGVDAAFDRLKRWGGRVHDIIACVHMRGDGDAGAVGQGVCAVQGVRRWLRWPGVLKDSLGTGSGDKRGLCGFIPTPGARRCSLEGRLADAVRSPVAWGLRRRGVSGPTGGGGPAPP